MVNVDVVMAKEGLLIDPALMTMVLLALRLPDSRLVTSSLLGAVMAHVDDIDTLTPDELRQDDEDVVSEYSAGNMI